MIVVTDLSKRYANGYQALNQVSFNIAQGEMVFVAGHSGAGKSTLLRLLAGMEQPSQGKIEVRGQDIHRLKPAAASTYRRSLGLIFQDHKILFDRSVAENVALPLYIEGYADVDVAPRVRAALDKVGLLKYEKNLPETLSGGEQQRLCIARALVHRPALLLADEPTGNLDDDYARSILEIFVAFNQVGVTIVVATHDHTLLTSGRGRRLTLQQGRLIA